MPQRLDASSLPELERLYRTFFAVQADFATALASESIPASPTKMARPSFQPRRLSFTLVTVVASTVGPGNTQERTCNPSRVRARPTTTCGWFPRPSLLYPRLRSGWQG